MGKLSKNAELTLEILNGLETVKDYYKYLGVKSKDNTNISLSACATFLKKFAPNGAKLVKFTDQNKVFGKYMHGENQNAGDLFIFFQRCTYEDKGGISFNLTQSNATTENIDIWRSCLNDKLNIGQFSFEKGNWTLVFPVGTNGKVTFKASEIDKLFA